VIWQQWRAVGIFARYFGATCSMRTMTDQRTAASRPPSQRVGLMETRLRLTLCTATAEATPPAIYGIVGHHNG
jgi:hypothetical protein